jgi:hypothetical protein
MQKAFDFTVVEGRNGKGQKVARWPFAEGN